MNCPHCSREFNPLEGQEFCSYCGAALTKVEAEETRSPFVSASEGGSKATGFSEASGTARAEYSPWEDIHSLGFFRGLGLTIWQSLFSPAHFFSRMPLKGGLVNPLLYAVMVQSAGNMVGYLGSFVVPNPFLAQVKLSAGATVTLALLIPPLAFLWVVAWSLLLHSSLFLVAGSSKDFEATLRLVCYCSSADLLNAIPVAGGLIALIWKLYMLIIGVRQIHDVSWGRSAAAVFLPLLVCCGVFVGGTMLAVMGLSGLYD